MKYYLVGYMYSGKSTFGPRLAAAKGLGFVDLDQAFEAKYHYEVARFFEVFGEEAFRKLETQMLHATAQLDNVVISTGGGTPCHGGNMDFILQHGTAIYLQMPVDALVERALHSRHERPRLHGLPKEEMHTAIAHDLALREPIYLRAPIHLNGTSPQPDQVP